MTLDKLHAQIQEAEHKAKKIDGRRFNKRSHVRMDREMRDINRAQGKITSKSDKMRCNRGSMYSEEEIEFANAENKKFREETALKIKEREEKCIIEDKKEVKIVEEET